MESKLWDEEEGGGDFFEENFVNENSKKFKELNETILFILGLTSTFS